MDWLESPSSVSHERGKTQSLDSGYGGDQEATLATDTNRKSGLGSSWTGSQLSVAVHDLDLAASGRRDYTRCRDCQARGEVRCRDCMVMFCGRHAEQHRQNNATSAHLVETEEERGSNAQQCSRHEDKPCSGFCETCQTLVCPRCRCVSTKVHHVVTVNAAARERRTNLQSLVTSTRTLALEELVTSVERVTDSKSRLLEQSSRLQDEIKALYSKQIEMLMEEQSMLLDQVAAVTNENLASIKKQSSNLQSVLGSTNSSLEFTRCALSLSSDAEIIAMHGTLSSRLHSVCNTSAQAARIQLPVMDHPLPEFKVNHDAVSRLQDLLTETGLSTLEPPENDGSSDEEDAADRVGLVDADVCPAKPLKAEKSSSHPSALRAKKDSDPMEISFLKTMSQVTPQPVSLALGGAL